MSSTSTSAQWIVFFRAGALGDFLLSMPLLKALSAQARPVCLITRSSYLGLLPPGCRADQVLDIEHHDVTALFGGSRPSPATSEILRGSDMYVFCPYDAVFEKNCRTYGVNHTHWLNSRPTRPPHAAVQFFQDAGLEPPHDLLTTPLWERQQTGRHLWLHPGSGSHEKNAPLELLAEFAADWQQDRHETVWISFGEADLNLKPPLAGALDARQVHFETLTMPSLAELREALAARAELFVGNDCGVSHLAALLGVPTIAFFKTTDPEIWKPIGNCTVQTVTTRISST